MATIPCGARRAMLIPDSPPRLSPAEARHSELVATHLHKLLAAGGGWLPFSRFMDAALYAPGLGYYMAGQARFGPGGDFVTAPEISPLFARCLARQVAEMLERAGGGDLVEYGAGSGILAVGLLQALAEMNALPRRYRIVEISAPLRAQQRERFAELPELARRVEWLDGPPATDWQGVAIANEVLDAIPVDRFRAGAGGCEAIGVVAAGDGFAWQAQPADAALAEAAMKIGESLPELLPDGYVSEWRPVLPAWIAAATATIKKGALLLCDYGLPRSPYYHASRDGGSLCAFYRHRRIEDVFARPGLQDLTAWVDFTAVAEAAAGTGLEIAGFATQAHFLAALGIDRELAALLEGAGTREALALSQGASMLLLPGEMGERFKVMALTRGIAGPFTGFDFRDLSPSL
ncbi:MAG: class I SAM-dependent methyltransferase [Steroidobacteraceae bacterium]